MYGQMGHTLKAFIIIIMIIIIIIIIIIIKTPFYLLKINKRTNKKYLCNSNFCNALLLNICFCETCFLASR